MKLKGFTSGVTQVYAKWMQREPLFDGFLPHEDCIAGGGHAKCYEPSRVLVLAAVAQIFACWLVSALSSRIPMYRSLSWKNKFMWCVAFNGLMNSIYALVESCRAVPMNRFTYFRNGTDFPDLTARPQHMEVMAAYFLGHYAFEAVVMIGAKLTGVFKPDTCNVPLQLSFVAAALMTMTTGYCSFIFAGLMLCEVATPVLKVAHLSKALQIDKGMYVMGAINMLMAFALIARLFVFTYLSGKMYKAWEKRALLPEETQIGFGVYVAIGVGLIPFWMSELKSVAQDLGEDTAPGTLHRGKKTN